MAAPTALILAVTLLSVGCTGDSPRNDGPLVVQDAITVQAWAQDVGTVVSFGATTVRNPTGEPIAATRVRPQIDDPDNFGFRVDSVYLVDVSTVDEISAFWVGASYTNRGATPIPVTGAFLNANSTYQVVFVTTLVRPGKWTMPSFDIDYEVAGSAYVATVPSGLRLCAPASADCAPP